MNLGGIPLSIMVEAYESGDIPLPSMVEAYESGGIPLSSVIMIIKKKILGVHLIKMRIYFNFYFLVLIYRHPGI